MTDQLVLDRLGVEKTIENYHKPWVAEFNGKKIYLFPVTTPSATALALPTVE